MALLFSGGPSRRRQTDRRGRVPSAPADAHPQAGAAGTMQGADIPDVFEAPPLVLRDSETERAGAGDELERFEGLARDCLEECRRELMMSFRFLSMALWHMPLKPESGMPPLATDGRAVYFDPVQTVLLYRHHPALLARSYLHLILHCIFRHPFQRPEMETRAYCIASDLIIEATALDMCGTRYECEGDAERRAAIEDLAARWGDFRPRTVMRAVAVSYADARGTGAAAEAEAAGERDVLLPAGAARGPAQLGAAQLLSAEEIAAIDQLFEFDSHRKWECYRNDDESDEGEDRNVSGRPENADEGASGSGDTPQPRESEGAGSDNRGNDEGDAAGDAGGDSEAPGEQGEDADSESAPQAGAGAAGAGSQEDAAEGSGGDSDSPDADGDEEPQDEDGTGEADAEESPDGSDDAPEDDLPAGASGATSSEAADAAEREWDEISRQVQMELKSHRAQWGDEAGELSAVLQIQNRKRYDYADFLRRFSTMQEDMRLSDDEFDYIYYTYGLRRYGNMPLIEPLEYTECKRIREFAVVIDTSESCSGELVTRFIRRTYDILKESESFFSQVNIHIVQCDARVQRDTKVENLDELERCLDDFEIFGLGGTDFRPAFEYVDELVEDGEFDNLQGLVYFTDGRGTFPERQPDYDTAFVFLSDGAERVRIPPWAMKVVMDESEIRDL